MIHRLVSSGGHVCSRAVPARMAAEQGSAFTREWLSTPLFSTRMLATHLWSGTLGQAEDARRHGDLESDAGRYSGPGEGGAQHLLRISRYACPVRGMRGMCMVCVCSSALVLLSYIQHQ